MRMSFTCDNYASYGRNSNYGIMTVVNNDIDNTTEPILKDPSH